MNNLVDFYSHYLNPILSLKPRFFLRDGIFSPIQRYNITKTDDTHSYSIIGSRSYAFYKLFFPDDDIHLIPPTDSINPLLPEGLINLIENNILYDISLLKRDLFSQESHAPILGDHSDIWISNRASVGKFVSFDTVNGPIVIDDDASISDFTSLYGPIYIGKNTKINRAFIRSSIIGENCTISGEVNSCIIGDFTNKAHEGFLGHSLIGDWVNLGALTTTSNLKNNYGEVSLYYGDTETHKTNTIKFGSIIGDFTKTGIGTMLNTGSILDVATVLFEGRAFQKYYPPFFWGGASPEKYKLEKFMHDIHFIMSRKNKKIPSSVSFLIEDLYTKV